MSPEAASLRDRRLAGQSGLWQRSAQRLDRQATVHAHVTANQKTPAPRSRQLWLVPSQGDTGRHLVAEVAVDIPVMNLYTYAVPEELTAIVRPGALVTVPYGRGRRQAPGLCVRLTQQPWDHTRRPILAAEPGQPWLSEPLIELGLWVSEYYVCSPWKTFAAVLPPALRKPRARLVAYLRATGAPLTAKLTAKQESLLSAIGGQELRQTDALRQAGVSPATLATLCRRGLVERVVRREPIPPAPLADVKPAEACPEDDFELTLGQQEAGEQIRAALQSPDPFRVLVLFGVPASGKTEVYVRVMRDVTAAGRQTILLIPEIALATQVVDRLARRFSRAVVLHSQLPRRLRHDTLAAIAAGQVDVIIGTRSAVFAPCPNLGLIVVDEEQEGSFKNLAAPFYHARDVAIKRGQLERVPVVLGSATPSLETWHNVQQRSHFQLVRLPERVPGTRLPEVRLVRSADRGPDQPGALLSPLLAHQVESTLASGQQVILLHNRRGYAAYLRCSRCGLAVNCEHCGTHLVYHRSERVMKCHRCGRRTPVPTRCLDSTCRGPLARAGSAIQRLEEELRQQFQQARLLRLDSDTMRRREDYRAALQGFEAGQADILLGTQMVAKGLDFPKVRLVGVIDADAALSLPDFRAAERVFQMIVQVVGRAGRREGPSLAVVQAAERPPPVIHHALRMDYEAFAAEELALRRRLFYPPAARMARLICADARPHRARQEAQRLANTLQQQAGRVHAGLRVDPAEACVIRQVRDLLRYEVVVRGPRGTSLQSLLGQLLREKDGLPRVQRLTVDIDPVDLL
jgi:primosomal protein N' (replication factor Y)